MEAVKWSDLLGKEVVALRGVRQCQERSEANLPIRFVLFSDFTYLHLREQDYYDCHDCDHSARTLELIRDKEFWLQLFRCEKWFDEATGGIDV